MWTIQRVLLRRLFKFAYELGKFNTEKAMPNLSEEDLNQECDAWITKHIENR